MIIIPWFFNEPIENETIDRFDQFFVIALIRFHDYTNPNCSIKNYEGAVYSLLFETFLMLLIYLIGHFSPSEAFWIKII